MQPSSDSDDTGHNAHTVVEPESACADQYRPVVRVPTLLSYRACAIAGKEVLDLLGLRCGDYN